MDLAVVMRQEILADKLEDGRVHGRAVATWNTRRLPTRLTVGWTNRLFVAAEGRWRGYFPLSGDVFWNPKDAAAPYALIFDPRRWTPIAAAPCPSLLRVERGDAARLPYARWYFWISSATTSRRPRAAGIR